VKTLAIALLGALIATLLVAAPVAAQSPVVTAEVDRTEATTDDVITLTIVVEGVYQIPRPRLPFLDGLVVVGSSSLSETIITNGKTAGRHQFQFRLAATRTGKITIEPIAISIDGNEQKTAPIELDVTQGVGSLSAPTPTPDFDFGSSTAPSTLAGQDQFVEAGVDVPNPYLGQQLTYFRKYYVVRDAVREAFFVRRASTPPGFDGFWHQELSDEGRYQVQAAGRRYNVYEEQTVLFPTLVGSVTIDPSVTRVSTSPLRPPEELVTRAVQVQVRPLPANAPDGFTGAVGEYRIEATVDSGRLLGGDPATLSVTISGSGNIDALPVPVLPETTDWRSFSQDSSASSQVFNGVLRGSKTFTFLLLPNTDGALQFPPIEYVYFDPIRETYVTMVSDPIRIEVEPGSIDIVAVQEALREAATDSDGAEEAVVTQDQPRGLKPVTGPLSMQGKGFASPAWYWALFAIPLLALVTLEAFGARRRLARALDRALGAVSLTRRRDKQAAPVSVDRSPDARLLDHLSGLLRRPAAGLANDRLALELGRLGADAGLIGDVRAVLDTGNESRFAPPNMRQEAGETPEQESVDELIRRLDEALQ
jgi:hypothetical protein